MKVKEVNKGTNWRSKFQRTQNEIAKIKMRYFFNFILFQTHSHFLQWYYSSKNWNFKMFFFSNRFQASKKIRDQIREHERLINSRYATKLINMLLAVEKCFASIIRKVKQIIIIFFNIETNDKFNLIFLWLFVRIISISPF